MIHTVKGFCVVNEAEVDIFLAFCCFFYDPTDGSNLIFGSSAISKPSLYIGKFLVVCVCVCVCVCVYTHASGKAKKEAEAMKRRNWEPPGVR